MRFRPAPPRGVHQAPAELPAGVRWVESIALPVGRAYSYERISTTKQEEGVGLERQRELVERWCEANGVPLDTELKLEDVGRSAFKGRHLEGCFGRFLKLAKERKLGLCPILLIENLDRVSRLEPVQALQDVIFSLMEADVALVVLSPNGQAEVFERENCDMLKLFRLIVELEKANKISKDLSDRITNAWQKTDEKLRKGIIERPQHICPRWCRWDEVGQRYELIDERVQVVRRVMEVFAENGAKKTAAILNAEGHPAFGRWEDKEGREKVRTWNPGSVRALILNDALWGAATIYKSGAQGPTHYYDAKFDRAVRVYHARRSHAARKAGEYELVEGVFPPVASREEVERLRNRCTARLDRLTEHVRSNEEMRWFGSRLTYCRCGCLMSWTYARTTKKSFDPEVFNGRRIYLICRSRQRFGVGHPGRCERKFMPLMATAAHVLNRLTPAHLAALVGGPHHERHDELDQQVELAAGRVKELDETLSRFRANLEKAMESTADFAVIQPLLDRQLELQRQLSEEEDVLAELRNELALRVDPPHLDEANGAIQELRDALASHNSNAEQRRRVNKVLVDLGIRIHLDGETREVGLQVQDGPIDWQPLNPEASLGANKLGVVAATAEQEVVADRAIELVIQRTTRRAS